MDDSSKSFICVEDITGSQEELNKVLYQPKATVEHNMKYMKRITKERFGISLSDEQIKSLVKHDEYHHTNFIKKYREIIFG